jgi:hypothetical protein
MKLKLIRFFILGALALNACYLSAQVVELDEYKAEIGLAGGGSYYLGDANSQLFFNMQPSYGGFFRYILNQRIAFRAELNYTGIKYLDLTTPTEFNKTFNDTIYSADFCGEFNFFDLERNPYKRLSKTFSPYIFAGVGMIYSDSIKASIPFGIGMKVKLAKRWNLNVQWSNRLSFGDNLEGKPILNNPNRLNGTNIFNNDLLSTFTIGISYDIWKKPCDCVNSSTTKDSHKYKNKSN